MNRPLRLLSVGLLAIFGVLALTATYLQAIAGPTYRDDPRNARVAAGLSGRERGGIISADGVIVAESVTNPSDPLTFLRSYPEGGMYAHAVGYSTFLFGDTGLEDSRSGALASGRDATISGILTALTGGDLRPRGLRLTIRHDLQAAAAEALRNERGAIVALNTGTGAILAMVSSPTYDPNALVGPNGGAAAEALESDRSDPLLNRAIAALYPPGSTFKVVTTSAALETGIAGPETVFADPAALVLPNSTSTIRNFDREPCIDGDFVTLSVAFIRSCNTVFGQLGMDVGAASLGRSAEAGGFNESVPMELETAASTFPADLAGDLAALAQSAIGQRDVRATPLQMAMFAAAVVNGGQVMTPYLIDEEFNADGEVVEVARPEVWRRAMSPATASVIRSLMEQVVTDGTGRRAAVPGHVIGGKTGTAEVPDSPPHVWFIGFGRSPEGGTMAVAVLVESGGSLDEAGTGGTVAAPIAAELFRVGLGEGR